MHAAQDKEEMQRAMQAKLPAKIDIGPVYNVDPQRRKAYSGAHCPTLLCSAPHPHASACMLCPMPQLNLPKDHSWPL